MEKQHIGKFYIDEILVKNGNIYAILEKLQFIPYRAELLFHRLQFEYIGASPLFKECSRNEAVPVYDIKMDPSKGINVQITTED